MAADRVAELARRYCQVGTAAVFSTLEAMGAPTRLFALDIRPIRPDLVLAGPAFTLKGARDPRPHHTPDTEIAKFDDYAMFRAMTPGCILVVDPGERERTGFWGDLMAAASYASGARGIVIDGCSRDTRELVQMPHFPVFARRTTMSSNERRVLTIDFQVPIGIAGAFEHQVEVQPGDWIYGDVDGVVAIPPDLIEQVLITAEQTEQRETAIRKEFETGLPAWEVYARHRRF